MLERSSNEVGALCAVETFAPTAYYALVHGVAYLSILGVIWMTGHVPSDRARSGSSAYAAVCLIGAATVVAMSAAQGRPRSLMAASLEQLGTGHRG